MERDGLGMDFTGCLGGFPGEIGIFSDGYESVWGEMGLIIRGECGMLRRLEREIIGFGRKFYDRRWKWGFW